MKRCGYNVLPIITQRRKLMKDEQLKKIADEQFAYSHAQAFDLVRDLVRDGNNGFTIQSIMMIGAAMVSSINEMEKPRFIDGCSKVYDAYKDFALDVDQLATGAKKP